MTREMGRIMWVLIVLSLWPALAMAQTGLVASPLGEEEGLMQLTSTAFKQNEAIPRQYTCEGEDLSPQLQWTGAPAGTKGFALISDDPDAPMGTWVHWVLWNLPPGAVELPKGLAKDQQLSDGTHQGITDFGRPGYGGPCPPPGKPHRYFFKLYALDTMLELSPGAKKSDLEKAIQGHILAQAELIGLYQR